MIWTNRHNARRRYASLWNSLLARAFIISVATLAVSSALCVGVRAGVSIGETPVSRLDAEIEDSDYEITSVELGR